MEVVVAADDPASREGEGSSDEDGIRPLPDAKGSESPDGPVSLADTNATESVIDREKTMSYASFYFAFIGSQFTRRPPPSTRAEVLSDLLETALYVYVSSFCPNLLCCVESRMSSIQTLSTSVCPGNTLGSRGRSVERRKCSAVHPCAERRR